MAVEVILPKLGMYEDDVTLVEWVAGDGTYVQPGDVLFVMVTDKVETEIEADDAGWLQHQAEAGFEAPIGTRIGLLHESEDAYRAAAGGGS